MLQMVSTQIDGAQKSLIQLRRNGYKTGSLRFARLSEYNSFTYNQYGYKIKDGFVHFSKIGKIKIILHRHIPQNAEIKQIIMSISKSGKWHACVIADVDSELPKISLTKSVGIDVGIKNFAYDSEGFVTANPLNLQKMLKPLRRVQRKISRRQYNSNNRKKVLRFYQIIHERIRNRRKDFLHKISTTYAKKYDAVFVERLAKLNMVKNHTVARSVLDSGWGIFGRMLDYKTMKIEVGARNTTVNCTRCGHPVPKSLAVRTHSCNVCGLTLDRGHNAAVNILKRGLKIFNIPSERRESTPAEILMRSKKQEVTNFDEWQFTIVRRCRSL